MPKKTQYFRITALGIETYEQPWELAAELDEETEGTVRGPEFFAEAPDRWLERWPEKGSLIIRGEIVIPEAAQVTTKHKIPS